MEQCDTCVNNAVDEDGEPYCAVNLDEDEMAWYLQFGQHRKTCPYYQPGDEYTLVRKQN